MSYFEFLDKWMMLSAFAKALACIVPAFVIVRLATGAKPADVARHVGIALLTVGVPALLFAILGSGIYLGQHLGFGKAWGVLVGLVAMLGTPLLIARIGHRPRRVAH
ncbi:hypothetical protein [Roseateles asaccharophilus]|uniref:VIT1/CCC1 family predicted Fe2+/Mn2+ transporter n=1 Tax=Roseateles asaccharophilus TaxID=582607 RepID=A0ABU2A4Q4_9BURK|nr:hypothetical protein [Roseateles asaccharophilus]MDR7331985.1 VIT1/CCC1 family predicted Fe2+/Mn2+ transporter [Roseateles asaccharophilus]